MNLLSIIHKGIIRFYVSSKIWPIFTHAWPCNYEILPIPKKSRDPGIGCFPISNPEIPIPIPKRQTLVTAAKNI